MVYNVEKLGTINIGRHGENLARVIEIDVSSMLKQWPDATITLIVKRNKDEAPYVAVTELVDGILYWPVTRAETAVPGNGLIEIRATCGETIAKSVTGFIRVSAALTGNETEPPETAKSWVDQVIEYGNEATQAAIKAKEEADRLSGINAKAVTLPAGSEAAVTVEEDCLIYGIPKGDKGDPGNDGYTPVKGVDYFDGEPGKDGTDATVTEDGIKSALGYTPANDADIAGKLTEPSSGLAVGKYFRIAAIDEAGHAVLEAVDAPVGGVQDVQVAGASVVTDGVANVPIANEFGRTGVVKLSPSGGIRWSKNIDALSVDYASQNAIDSRSSSNNPIIPYYLDFAVRAAMCDGKGAAWTDKEQAAARERMGIPGDYELIEEITLEEAVNAVDRSIEPDGTSYNFCNMFVKTYAPGDTYTATMNVRYYYSEVASIIAYISSAVGTGDRYGISKAEEKFGYLEAYGSVSVSTAHSALLSLTGTTYSEYMTRSGTIKRLSIILQGAKLLPVGSKIQIYGVRA